MANTYSSLFFHIVFSTKNRAKSIRPEFEERLWQYIGGIARTHELSALKVGGIEDHIHALVLAKPKHSSSEIALWLKAESSKWVHQEIGHKLFAWQDGFGVFSVSRSNLPAVIKYIEGQREHHERETFEQEYERLMQLHEVDYDPKYLLD